MPISLASHSRCSGFDSRVVNYKKKIMARFYGAGALFYGTFQLFFPPCFNEKMAGYFIVSIGHRQHYQEQKDLISLVYYINPLISFRNKIVK